MNSQFSCLNLPGIGIIRHAPPCLITSYIATLVLTLLRGTYFQVEGDD